MLRILVLFIFLPFACFAQKQGNIWYFGDHAGLDFNSGVPVLLEDGQTADTGCPSCHSEGTAVMADSSGALLFYCDGSTIWNRQHQVMPNGTGLTSSISATQSSLIIPLPGSSRYFYVFTVDDFFDDLQDGFRYSVVDMCLDNGMGDVISEQKNVLLLDTVAEKLTAVRHANGTDYWIIVHKYYSDAFHAYHLSAAGIVNAVVSNTGSVHPTVMGIGGSIGQMKASPNGEKLAVVGGNGNVVAEYFDFDKTTGVVSNPYYLPIGVADNFYGVSFSPDNTKLYVACVVNCQGVWQYDLAAGDSLAIAASKTLISGQNGNFLGLQLATDGKIYVARSPFQTHAYLGVINQPNNAGMSCNYIDSAINLNGHHASYGFPNFVDSYDYSNTVSPCKVADIDEAYAGQLLIFPNPFTQETTIRFGQQPTNASLIVYNAFGQKTKVIENISEQTIALQRDGLANGVYFVSLEENGKVLLTKKLVIVD
ncbi:MAG TPA: T9SS type A sorting domain-containing protein [Fluviicola sp.]|nr:T9SS type A sorting domain-containing protein [Fluviicola sp.]